MNSKMGKPCPHPLCLNGAVPLQLQLHLSVLHLLRGRPIQYQSEVRDGAGRLSVRTGKGNGLLMESMQ